MVAENRKSKTIIWGDSFMTAFQNFTGRVGVTEECSSIGREKTNLCLDAKTKSKEVRTGWLTVRDVEQFESFTIWYVSLSLKIHPFNAFSIIWNILSMMIIILHEIISAMYEIRTNYQKASIILQIIFSSLRAGKPV